MKSHPFSTVWDPNKGLWASRGGCGTWLRMKCLFVWFYTCLVMPSMVSVTAIIMNPQNKQLQYKEADSIVAKTWFYWLLLTRSQLLPNLLKMLTMNNNRDQSRSNIYVWLSSILWLPFTERMMNDIRCSQLQNMCACVSPQTYRFPSSWFPVVPKHQLQIDSFTPLHLFFQLILARKLAQAQICSENQAEKNQLFLKIKKKLHTFSRGGKWTNPR